MQNLIPSALAEHHLQSGELASLLTLSDAVISELGRTGILPRIKDPNDSRRRAYLYPATECLLAYIGYLRRDELKAKAELMVERSKSAKVARQKAELEMAVVQGELVPRAQILARFGAALTVFRRQLLSLPARASRRLLSAKDHVEISTVLEIELLDALSTLAELLESGATQKNGQFAQEKTL